MYFFYSTSVNLGETQRKDPDTQENWPIPGTSSNATNLSASKKTRESFESVIAASVEENDQNLYDFEDEESRDDNESDSSFGSAGKHCGFYIFIICRIWVLDLFKNPITFFSIFYTTIEKYWIFAFL